MFPRHFGGRRVQRDQRIGEAGAVHMQRHAVFLCHRRNRRNFVQRIDGAGFRRLGKSDRGRPAAMDVARRKRADGAIETVRAHAAIRAVHRAKPPAAREILRRAALIHHHMGLAMAEGNAARAIEQRERQSVRRRAGADEEDFDVALENLAEFRGNRPVQRASAIGCVISAGVALKVLGDPRVNASPVVGRKLHRNVREVRRRERRQDGIPQPDSRSRRIDRCSRRERDLKMRNSAPGATDYVVVALDCFRFGLVWGGGFCHKKFRTVVLSYLFRAGVAGSSAARRRLPAAFRDSVTRYPATCEKTKG